MKNWTLIILALFPFLLVAQTPENNDTIVQTQASSFNSQQLIVPGALVALSMYGSVYWDKNIQKQTVKWNGNTSIDDALVFVPGASVYLLDWCGISSKHNFTDKTVIAATTAAITLGTTFFLKETTNVMRPDGSNNKSFPSMHTAVAFAGAELLRQEYKDQSAWYGIAGYGVAASCGFLRVYNNKHWFSDILVGAGVGILSTRAAYWMFPSLKKLYSSDDGQKEMSILPFVSENGIGFGLSARF